MKEKVCEIRYSEEDKKIERVKERDGGEKEKERVSREKEI